jgi:hypothetical protein
MARNANTATTDVPMAAMTEPTSPPMAFAVAQLPWHCRPMNPAPMRPPASPPSKIDTNARPRASGDGSALSGRSRSDSTLRVYGNRLAAKGGE